MRNSNKILSIDISSKKVKIGIISEKLELESTSVQNYDIIDEDIDGFAKRFNMDEIWNKVKLGIKSVLKDNKPRNIIGVSSCGQRMATVFLDKQGKEIYGGPNIDMRGIDSAYLIEEEFTEEELFNITAHSPFLMFTLARLLWFKEEKEDQYKKIGKLLMLDDWIVYKLTGNFYSDYTSLGESLLFDISKKNWSSEIIEAFDINPDIFPDIVCPSTYVGDLKPTLIKEFDINQNLVPILKGCGDTHANLLGMGVIEAGNIGISLGTTAPIHLVVDKPLIDPNLNFWTNCHIIKDKWLIEANTGGTGRVYDWFKSTFIHSSDRDANEIMNEYMTKNLPGAGSTFAFLGPELMAIKDQTSIKRGVFIFTPPSMISEELPKVENFAQSTIEGICFGILENFLALHNFTQSEIKTFSSGGMAKSHEFCKILANILNQEINVPKHKDSAFIGCAMNVLLGLNLYQDYRTIINNLIEFEKYKVDTQISNKYMKIYKEWKNLKNQVNQL
ncbi:MAG: FGGY family carbohydrate kinase [Candidatus Thorarchaeota archaeon]